MITIETLSPLRGGCAFIKKSFKVKLNYVILLNFHLRKRGFSLISGPLTPHGRLLRKFLPEIAQFKAAAAVEFCGASPAS